MVQNNSIKTHSQETPNLYINYERLQNRAYSKNNNQKQINQVKKIKKQNESLSRLSTVVTSLKDRLDPNNEVLNSSRFNKSFEDDVPALIDESNSSFESNDSDFLFNTSFLKEDYDDASPIFQRKRL